MNALEPGSTIGVLGGGQLARMLALEARRMGYRIAILDPDPRASAAPVADRHFVGSLDDVDAALRLARASDVVTLDTEHVPAGLLERLEVVTPVRPGARVLRIVQDRREQRRFLDALGVPQVPTAPVHDAATLRAAPRVTGFPCVLKTRRSGYDGKGQVRIDHEEELAGAWRAIDEAPAMMESFIEYDREISVLLARGREGAVRFHPLAENDHRNHILHTTRAPARVPEPVARAARGIGAAIARALDHVGMLAVELFVTRDGRVLVNEIAPRTHNSGHFTLGACVTSQFEQHVRAVCGLPLGDPSLLRPAMMLNVLGDAWAHGTPPWRVVDAHPNAKLHLYGKATPRPGRKMGHVLVLGDDREDPEPVVARIAAGLAPRPAAAARPA